MAKSKEKKSSKSPKEKARGKGKKDKKKKTPRDPYNASDKRGLMTDSEIVDAKARAEVEQNLKKFGPCHFDANHCATAILMLQSEEPHIVIGALNCLQKFCKKSVENCELFMELEGFPILAKLINSDNQVIQRLSLKVMTIVSKVHKAKLAMRDLDLVKDFLSLTKSPDEVVQEYSSYLLSQLATLYTGRLQIIQNDGLTKLLDLLQHPDPDIVRNSIETIWRILEDPLNIDLLLSEDILKSIMKLIDSDYPSIQVVAMSVLQKVAISSHGTDLLDKLNLIEKLGNKLSKMEQGDLHRVALKTLTNMAQSRSCCAKMTQIVDHLLNVIDNTSDDKTLIHAVRLAGKIACTSGIAKKLLDGGFGEKLVQFLGSDDLNLVSVAAMATAQISACDARASKILKKAIESLLDYAEHPNVTMQGFENVITAISHILESGKEAGHLFLEWGGKEMLVKVLKNMEKYSDDALISAMTCIHNVSLHWALRPFIADPDIIAGIVGVMEKSNNPQLLVAAATAMTGLLCEHKALVGFLNHQGDKQLLKYIQHPEYPVVISAVPIIHIAGVYEDVALEMIERGVLEELWKREDLIGLQGPFRTAFERLLCSNLSAKFAIAGHLDPFEKLPDGFYAYGAVTTSSDFTSLKKIQTDQESKEHDNLKKILYLNLTTNVDPGLRDQNPIFTKMIEEDDTCQKVWDKIIEIIQTDDIRNEKEVVKVIAQVVTDRLGGMVDKWRVSYEAEELEMANLQTQFKSRVVPITMMSTAAHRPRAILFKAMADAFGIPCSLERGGYRKVWNVVLLRSKKKHPKPCSCTKTVGGGDEDAEKRTECLENVNMQKNVVFTEKLRRFVVDLIHQPGTLLPFHSYEANAYCFF